MKKLIICSKKSGNTYKVCSYINSNSNVELKFATDIKKNDLLQYDMIILSSGVYGGTIHNNLLKWINSIDKDSFKKNVKIHLFLTWLGRGKSAKSGYNKVSKFLNEKGLQLDKDYMTCFGKSFYFIRRSHPNIKDLINVVEWVRKL